MVLYIVSHLDKLLLNKKMDWKLQILAFLLSGQKSSKAKKEAKLFDSVKYRNMMR